MSSPISECQEPAQVTPADSGRKQPEEVTPEDWAVVPLGKLFKFQNGVNAEKKAYGSGVPFANVLEVITHSHLRAADIPGHISLPTDAIARYQLRRGDVLFNRTSETQEEIGLASVYSDDELAVFGGFVIKGRAITNRLDPEFTGYAFRSRFVRNQIVAKGQGAIRANIGQADLKQVTVAIPPPIEQRAIAAALSDVDSLIGALNKFIAKKRAIRLGASQQLLNGRRRLIRTSTDPRFLATNIGRIPIDWQVIMLGELCVKIQDGTHFSPKLDGGEFLYVTSRNIGRGNLDISNAGRISKYEHDGIYKRCDVIKGDLLLTKDGANTGNAAINWVDDPFSLLSSVAFLRFDRSKAIAEFYLQYILSTEGQNRLKDLMSGNAITRLTLQKIRSFSVPVPPLVEQLAIAKVLSDIDAEIRGLEIRRKKTLAIKRGMMQQLLTGRIRLVKPETRA